MTQAEVETEANNTVTTATEVGLEGQIQEEKDQITGEFKKEVPFYHHNGRISHSKTLYAL